MLVDPVKQRKAKQRKEKQRKQIMTKSPSTFHQKSSKIVLKSRSRGGLGNSWGLSLLQVALSWASWGVLGSIWHKKLEKRRKTEPFWLFLERLGRHFGAHVGSKRPSWLHLGRLGLDFGSLWVDFGSIFWLLVPWAALKKKIEKIRFCVF